MSRFRILSMGTALVAALFVGSAVQAAAVSYTSTGLFTYDIGGGPVVSNVYDNGMGAVITFEGSPTNELDLFPSNVSFGSFLTAGTTGNPTAVSGTFQLTILQSDPTGDILVFDAVLGGNLGAGGGTDAFIRFTTLTRISADGSSIVTYSIVNGADGTPGKLNIAAPDAGGRSTIEGRVDFSTAVIPEPSAIALLGLAAPAALAYSLRRRRGN